jgi:uncharacterized damage-inducible protein DinB
MTVKDLQRLYEYGYWANAKLFPVIAQLTPEQFTHPVVGGHESVRNTIVHVMSAEWGWISRCGGPERGPALKPADFPTVESVLETWKKVEGYVREFLARIPDADLARDVEFSLPGLEKRSMAIGELLQHGAIHAVHHRGQVAVLLRMLGHTPGNFDLLFYDAERRAATA